MCGGSLIKNRSSRQYVYADNPFRDTTGYDRQAAVNSVAKRGPRPRPIRVKFWPETSPPSILLENDCAMLDKVR